MEKFNEVFIKVGSHGTDDWHNIIERKQEDIKKHKYTFWAQKYSVETIRKRINPELKTKVFLYFTKSNIPKSTLDDGKSESFIANKVFNFMNDSTEDCLISNVICFNKKDTKKETTALKIKSITMSDTLTSPKLLNYKSLNKKNENSLSKSFTGINSFCIGEKNGIGEYESELDEKLLNRVKELESRYIGFFILDKENPFVIVKKV